MNLVNVWLSLPLQKRVISIVSVIATMALLFGLVSLTMRPQMSLLYSGLEPSTAGDVVAKLENVGASYEVRGNAIYTETKRRDELRLELAREGLPRQSVVGYELFDDMNSFSMSSEMFDATYWRAKEGELARTLLAMPNVNAARVHLGAQKTSGFRAGQQASTASVTLSTSNGLNSEQAKAVQYMTALAIVGLKPEDVAVIDTVRGLVAGPGLESQAETGGNGELERAASLKKDLLSMLEARVGGGNARVTVSLEIDRTKEISTQRLFDPEQRVIRSQTTAESSDSSQGQNASVTVASNLPEGAAGGGNSTSERSESNETVTYEISEIVTNKERLPGAIKRMSIAVLVGDQQSIADDGTVSWTPRGAEELTALEELISAAAGLDEARGDSLTVRSLSFNQPAVEDFVVAPSLWDEFKEQYFWSTIQSLILGIFALIMGLFVVRPILTSKEIDGGELGSDMMGLGMDSPMGMAPGLEGGADMMALGDGGGLPALGDGGIDMDFAGGFVGDTAEDPIDMLNSQASENVDEAAELLSGWLSQSAPNPAGAA